MLVLVFRDSREIPVHTLTTRFKESPAHNLVTSSGNLATFNSMLALTKFAKQHPPKLELFAEDNGTRDLLPTIVLLEQEVHQLQDLNHQSWLMTPKDSSTMTESPEEVVHPDFCKDC